MSQRTATRQADNDDEHGPAIANCSATVRGRNGSRDGAAAGAGAAGVAALAIDAGQERQRHVCAPPRWTAAFNICRAASISPRSNAAMPLWSNSSDSRCCSAIALRAVDICARARVTAIEKQRPRPDVDGLRVVGGEVVVETAISRLSILASRSASPSLGGAAVV